MIVTASRAVADALSDLRRWDASTSELRIEAGRQVEAAAEGFVFRGLETHAFLDVRHEAAVFLHAESGLEFVLVPGGTFVKTAPPFPRHWPAEAIDVRVEEPFLLSRAEVTWRQWDRATGESRDEPEASAYPIRRSEEQDKRLRTAAQIAESERATIAKKAALSPGGKAAVAAAKAGKARLGAATAPTRRAAEGVQEKSASALARAGISEDLPQGPGAAAPGALAAGGPFTGEIDTGAQKGSEAYAQAGRAAAQRLRPSGRSELADRRRLEERKKRIERVTGGGGGNGSGSDGSGGRGAARGAPAPAALAARSGGEDAGGGGKAGVDERAAARSPSAPVQTATLRARSTGDASAASPGGNAPRTLPAAPAVPLARATIAASTTPLQRSWPSARAAGGAAGATIDLGAFGSGEAIATIGGGGVRGFEAPRTDDHTADFLGSDGLEQGLAGLQGMRRPGRTPRDLPWTPDLSVRYSDWSAIAHDSSSAGSPGYDELLETHRERVVDVARTIFEYLDHQVGDSGSQKRDAGRLDRAIEQYVRRTALSIYLQKLRDWKNEGKKGEKPDKHQIEDELAGIFDEARENDPADPPPPPAGTQSHASDPCAEERRKCQEECGCPCICTPTEGGGDDPLPTRDPSVRGLRMDLEVAGFFTPGPPRPGNVDDAMTVSEPDEPDYDLSQLGAGIYAQIPATSVRLRSLTRTVARAATRLARTDHPRRIQHLLRRIAELEKRIADELQRLFERWMADFIRGIVGSAHLSEDVPAQLRRALRPMFLRQFQLDLERHALRSALRHTRDKKGEEYELLSIRIEDLEFETTLNEGDAWDTTADVLALNDVHVGSVVQEHLEDLFLDAFETAVRQERREWPHRSKIEHEINDDWRLTVLASHPWTGWFGVRMDSGRGPKRWDELEPSWGSTLRVTLLDFNQERYRYDRRRIETQIARAGFWKDVNDRIERDGEAVVFAETFLWTWATLAAFTLPFAAGGAAATAVGGGTLASTATGAGVAGATQFGLSSLRQIATQHDVDAGQAAQEALWAAGIQGFSAVLGKLVAGRAT